MEPFEIRVDNDISLRLRKIEDAHELFDFTQRNRNFLKEFLGWLDFTKTVDDSLSFINDCNQGYTKGISLNLSIFYNKKMVGSIGFNLIDNHNKIAEIGYMLDEKLNGKGVMTKSCIALINYGFTVLKLNRIVIKAGEKNLKSRAIAERLNFSQEGILEQAEFLYDHYVNLVVYAMLKENWETK